MPLAEPSVIASASALDPPVFKELPVRRAGRKFGAAFVFRDDMGQPLLSHILGLGPQGQLRSRDVYRKIGQTPSLDLSPHGPRPRMCHALTDLGPGGLLLTGGRTSPAGGLQDAFLFRKETNEWVKTHHLPAPVYRHSAVRLGDSCLTLLVGGKTGAAQLFDRILLRHPGRGWVECQVSSAFRPTPVFGAVLICTGRGGDQNNTEPGRVVFCGVLCGGMVGDGRITDQVVRWQLDVTDLLVCSVPCRSRWGDANRVASILSSGSIPSREPI